MPVKCFSHGHYLVIGSLQWFIGRLKINQRISIICIFIMYLFIQLSIHLFLFLIEICQYFLMVQVCAVI